VPDARRRGHVLERAVATVSVQAVARSTGQCGIGDGTAVDDEDVEPAVIVKVEEEATRPHDLRKEPLFAGTVGVDEIESDLTSDIAEHRKPHRFTR
jgi:hypothetical protein